MEATSQGLRFLGVLISLTIISFLLIHLWRPGWQNRYSRFTTKEPWSQNQEPHCFVLDLPQESSGIEIKNHTSLNFPQKSHRVDIKNHTSLDLANSHGYNYVGVVVLGPDNIRDYERKKSLMLFVTFRNT